MASLSDDGNDAIGRKPIEVSECRVSHYCYVVTKKCTGSGTMEWPAPATCVCPETQGKYV